MTDKIILIIVGYIHFLRYACSYIRWRLGKVVSSAYAMKTYGRCILDISTSWRWVVSYMPLPRYPRKKRPCNIGWAPEPVWTTWREVNFCPFRDSNSDFLTVQPAARRFVVLYRWKSSCGEVDSYCIQWRVNYWFTQPRIRCLTRKHVFCYFDVDYEGM
jgi:hypothetical protein